MTDRVRYLAETEQALAECADHVPAMTERCWLSVKDRDIPEHIQEWLVRYYARVAIVEVLGR